ncbi:hypothetical protein HPB48_023172 [Haemaphysalis longicornis]|uniref:Mediator complex subunit 17 n=1 Tax=Haemaphysalis longicornis TaxID=44386 RepID=A0A9J6H6C9_HAELO|nr:hypothetical protein HPB48_023172 [Haemaphysalis longicornis]
MSNSSGGGGGGMAVSVCVEACQEYQVQEITYDGQEVYVQPCSMSENLTKLAQKIDFGQAAEEQAAAEKAAEKAAFQPSLWPWDSVRSKLRQALTEVSVLCDVLSIARQKHYLVLDPVSQEPAEYRPVAVLVAKKKGLAAAAGVLLTGAECLRGAADPSVGAACSSPRGVAAPPAPVSRGPDFHAELLHMRQNWRLRKVGATILGDLSYRSVSYSAFLFPVASKKRAPSLSSGTSAERAPVSGRAAPSRCPRATMRAGEAPAVTLPSELEGISYIQVTIQKDTENDSEWPALASTCLRTPSRAPRPTGSSALEAAQNVLFCRELFAQLAREAVQLQPSIPNLVVGNQITTALFPGVQLCIGLCHRTLQEGKPVYTEQRKE